MVQHYFEDALLLETKGLELYTRLAAEAKNRLSKELFTSLAEQEEYHLEYIKSYIDKEKFDKLLFDPLEEKLKTIFEKYHTDMDGKDLSQIAGLEKALQMEKDAYELYQVAYDEAKSKEDEDFLAYLMEMEDEHFEALANLHYYYTSNDQWISEDESKVWNWMNF